MTGRIDTEAGPVPRVSSELRWSDRLGRVKVRWGLGRMRYTVEPGLYALGDPGREDPVLVTANYKMSFDLLRQSLSGRNAWILALDTGGINVWCAAGKGTFGTGEVVGRIRSSNLEKIVSHRKLILPQLAGPGVAAHLVKRFSGFEVVYGPVRAADLPAFLDAGLKATPEMRIKTFGLKERAVLIPVEMVNALKWAVLVLPLFFLAGGLAGDAGFWPGAWDRGLPALIAILSALAAGTVLAPLLLPWLPGRAFSLKGLSVGLVAAILFTALGPGDFSHWQGRIEAGAWFLLITAITAYLVMDFTGASTYTSLSGVRREMKVAVPLEIAAGGSGLILWVGSLFIA